MIDDEQAILRTKVTPPRIRSPIHRERLYLLLDRGADGKLTLLSAPAGFGKTTLVAAWLAERGRDSAWISLDRSDGSRVRFLRYLAAATEPLFRRSGEAPSILTDLINELSDLDSDIVLVLDDYHLAGGPEIHDAVAFLLDHSPANLHVFILTRADPPLKLAKLRGRGELTELRVADLQFRVDEVGSYLSTGMGIDLSQEDLDLLTSHTEGWAAGIQMVGASLSNRDDAPEFIRNLTSENRYVLDYLLEEVLSRLDPEVEAFLLDASILERLTADLCAAVTGRDDSQRILERIDRSNLFIIPLDEERRWYRLHHLFADLLVSRLSDRNPDAIPELHRRASGWFEAHGLVVEAIDHLVAAGDLEEVANRIDRYGERVLMESENEAFLRWVDALTPEIIRAHPSIEMLRLWAGILRGGPVGPAEKQLRTPRVGSQMGAAMSVRAFLALARGDVAEAIDLADGAGRNLPENHQFLRGFAAWTRALAAVLGGDLDNGLDALDQAHRESLEAGNLFMAVMALSQRAELLVFQGSLSAAEAAYARALDLSGKPDGGRMAVGGAALIGLGEIARMRGDLDGAIGLFRAGIDCFRGWFPAGGIDGLLGLARALAAKGRVGESDAAIEEAEGIAAEFDASEYDDRLVRWCRDRLLLTSGRRERVHRAESGSISSPAGASHSHHFLLELEVLIGARLDLDRGDCDSCIQSARDVAGAARQRRHFFVLLEALLLEALANRREERLDDAFRAVADAVELAAPERCIQSFVDEGPEMARILFEARRAGLDHEFVGVLLAAYPLEDRSFAAGGALREADSVEPLSTREMEVLCLLAGGLSNKEVAAELFVSERTVKWHTSNIYAKLSVTSRTAAVARARQLGMLPE